MKVLSLYWGLSSTASLFIDGKIVGAVSEERFTRKKNDDEFPRHSIDYLLKEFNVKPEELDGVAIASYIQGLPFTLLRTAQWTVQDYVKAQREKWYPELFEGKKVSLLDIFPEKIKKDFYPQNYWQWDNLEKQSETFPKDREQIVADYLKIPVEKVRRIEHHRCHAAYGYYASTFRDEKVLVLTIDAMGDGKNATINIVHTDGSIERVFQTDQCHLGRIYRYMTLLMGMKPNEHEYKVMGLAPYGKPSIAKAALEVFRKTLYVDGIEFKYKEKPTDTYYWFKERLEGCRFDGIAAALQTWTEELMTTWVSNAIKEFNISTVVLSGGVSMNVKANGKIGELPGVKKLFIGGTSSDESMALSSGICLAQDLTIEKSAKWDPKKVESLPHLYLGPQATLEDEKKAVAAVPTDRYTVSEKYTTEQIAELLASGKVLARCVGRMEFGQRSLGNRSILADPIDTKVVEKINRMVKNRDFWMPFAPVMLDRFVDEYIVNPKGFESPHMTLAFETTAKGFECLPAGCHPADKSARAQILHRDANPELYQLMEAFEKKTGRGALMNTSFNLHGYPIVNTPDEAVDVLVRTELDGLILNNYLIVKR